MSDKFEYHLYPEEKAVHSRGVTSPSWICRNADGLTEEQASRIKTLYEWSQNATGGTQYKFFPEAFPATLAPPATADKGKLSEEQFAALALGSRLLDMSRQKSHADTLKGIAIKYSPGALADEEPEPKADRWVRTGEFEVPKPLQWYEALSYDKGNGRPVQGDGSIDDSLDDGKRWILKVREE